MKLAIVGTQVIYWMPNVAPWKWEEKGSKLLKRDCQD